MSDEYQLRKDIDGIYRKFYDYQRQQWNVITSDDLQEALDNLPTGGGDVSGDYITESELNRILGSYVVSSTLSSYALKSEIVTSYDDLTDKPYIPSKTSDLTNDSGFLTSHQSLRDYLTESEINQLLSSYALSSQLNNYYTKTEADNRYSQIGHNHSINDVTNLQSTLNSKANTNDLGDVAFSNDYSDLDNIPSSFTPSSHNHDERYYTESEIDTALNSKANSNHTHSYNDLNNKPTIDNALSSNSENAVQNKAVKSALDDKENIGSKVSSWSATTNNVRYPSEKLVKDSIDEKADILHGHSINDISTPIYSSAEVDALLTDIVGDTAIDVMNKIGMAYFLRNQTVYDVTGTVTGYWQGVMQYGLSAVLLDYIVNEEGVYEVRKQSGIQTTDLFYYYDGDSKLTLLTPMKVDWSISNYNPNIDSTVTVRARITDMFDNAIPYENVTLNYEAGGVGGSVNLISDSDGYVSYNYTCSNWGQCRFSIKTYSSFICVEGWRKFIDNSNYLGYYDNKNVSLNVVLPTSVSFPSTFTVFGSGNQIPTSIRPEYPIISPVYSNNNLLIAVRDDGGVYRRSMTGSTVNSTGWALLTWTYR